MDTAKIVTSCGRIVKTRVDSQQINADFSILWQSALGGCPGKLATIRFFLASHGLFRMNGVTPAKQTSSEQVVVVGMRTATFCVALILIMDALNGQNACSQQSNDSSHSLPNANLSVKYVGTQKCVECHKDQHSSFLRTLHSKAAQVTDPTKEPKPGAFDHTLSGNRYEVKVIGDQMFHRELLKGSDDKTVATTEHEMVMTLGSGTHAKSYLLREGDFYVQSPITYFEDDHKWSMSPGYDEPTTRSFRRTLTARCVFCHVGSIDQVNNNPYKFEILEAKIGCERCHGPGELHVQRHLKNPNWSDDPKLVGTDDTIVNPDSLPRELSESICQQCHCQGVQNVDVTGKDEWDYRPGLNLADFRADFQFRTEGDDAMRLVGHVEQLHQSKCYTETETLTCVTCHDPHDPPTADNLVQYNRDKCFQCHQNDACGKPLAERKTTNSNDCAMCHMPRRDTNVSHFALHNHRIAVHKEKPKPAGAVTQYFEPILKLGHLPKSEQLRLTGLAKYEMYRRFGGSPKFADYTVKATEDLIQVRQAGKADDEVNAALAWLAHEQGQAKIAEQLASGILNAQRGESMPRIVAAHVMAKVMFDRREFAKALALYRTLDGYHRDGSDTYFLGLAEANNRNTDKAIAALKRSIEIEPSQLGAHAALRAIYQSIGQEQQAKVHEQAVKQNQAIQARRSKAAQNMTRSFVP